MIAFAALAAASCIAVNAGSDQVRAADLAAAVAGLTVPATSIPVALAPAPGVQRVFRVAELRRMAQHFGWTGEPENDICVERPVTPPDPSQFLVAMRKAMPEADIAILDYGRQPVPAGELEFHPNGLHPGPSGALWTGAVRYAGTRHFAVWARVKVVVPVARLVAAVDLEPGHAISAEQVRVETRPEYPPDGPVLASSETVIGKWPRNAIRAGTAIRKVLLEEPKAVVRGDTVTVDVFNGAAHLELQAVAEGSGAVGETIPVLNPDSHRHFPARIDAKGRVSVGAATAKVNP